MLHNVTSNASDMSSSSPVKNDQPSSSASRKTISNGFVPSMMDRTVKHIVFAGSLKGQDDESLNWDAPLKVCFWPKAAQQPSVFKP